MNHRLWYTRPAGAWTEALPLDKWSGRRLTAVTLRADHTTRIRLRSPEPLIGTGGMERDDEVLLGRLSGDSR